jgi:hypothetical protein
VPGLQTISCYQRGRQLASHCSEKKWFLLKSTLAPADVSKRIQSYGFFPIEVSGGMYYLGPFGRILTFYEDGSWGDDSARGPITLNEYLEELTSQL